MNRSLQLLLISCLTISLGINGWLLWQKPAQTPQLGSQSNESYTADSEYKFLSKRIFATNQNDILINFVDLRERLRSYVDWNSDIEMGIYFEYLPSGISIGINDRANFVSASLLKVPIAMGILKEIELGQIHLTDIIIVREDMLDSRFGDLWKKGKDYSMTIEEALSEMIIKSDNTAKNLLLSKLNDARLKDVLDSLDIPPESEEEQPVVSAKNYSSILRSLYLSAYLSKDNSNYLLDLMTKSAFNEGLPAGIPDEIPIAHKIGVHTPYDNPKDLPVYTDCGVIFQPLRPYILCIMIKAKKETSHRMMKEISAAVYEYVSRSNK